MMDRLLIWAMVIIDVTYTENGPSVALGVSHLILVMDEEGHNISSMDIELVSTNGELDEGDILFLQTPMALPFISDPNTVITDRMISINFTGHSNDYTNVLQAVRYINTELELTLFVNGSYLMREVVIRITDTSTVTAATTNEVRVTIQIEPIKDNAPRIIMNSDPVCTEDYKDRGGVVTIRRRSAVPLMRNTHRRRCRSNTYIGKINSLAAPQVHEIKPHFIHSEKGSCLSEVVVTFNTDCNAPVVEVQQELDSLLTFATSSLAQTPHYGYWRDYQTLVVVFRVCVKNERNDEYSKKPLYVVFYDQGGSCDWDSPCNIGVCYYNSSGCPVTGYHRFHASTHDYYTLNATSYTDFRDTSEGLVIIVMSVVLVAMVTILICEWKLGQQRRFVVHHVPNENNSFLEDEPVVTNHIIDIKVPVVTTGNVKSLPPLSDTRISAGESQEELLKKDECRPPPYSQIEETNSASNTNSPMAIGSTSPSKASHLKQISSQGLYSSLGSKEGVTTVLTAEGEGQIEIHYVGREARVEGEVEQESDREGGEKYVIRGVGEYSLAVDGMESVQASVHTGIRSGEDHWKTRGRGGVARVKCHSDKDTTQLREHSQHSHSYWQYDDNTQHPH